MEIMFWIYVAVSVFASAGMYLVLWSTLYVLRYHITESNTDQWSSSCSVFPVHMMTPTWVFPAYPLLLTAPFATTLIAAAQRSGNQLSIDSTAIALCATSTQGTGCLIAFMISAAFLYRLMTQKLPRDMQRPGVVCWSLISFFRMASHDRVLKCIALELRCNGSRHNRLGVSIQMFADH